MAKYDELEKLNKLKQQGVLTETEFQFEKEKILNDTIDVKKTEEPIIQKHKINNFWVWLIAFSPIWVDLFLLNVVGLGDNSTYLVIWFIFNTIVCSIDNNLVKKEYHHNNLWFLFLVPVYLYKRSGIVRDTKAYFWVWLVCFILSIL